MNRINLHRLYKKYHDEVWGHLVLKKTFSYNKRAVLMNYKAVVLKRRIRLKNKYRYFRWKFLKALRLTIYKFKLLRRNTRYINRASRSTFKFTSSKSASLVNKSKIFKKHKLFCLLRSNLSYLTSFKKVYNKRASVSLFPSTIETTLELEKYRSRHYPNYSLRRVLIGKFKRFVRRNNTKHFLKRKLKLKRQRRFFYSVHIAAPRKKKKKKSLFALKHMYYKKISYFFGFKKISSFFKPYNTARKLWGRNQFAVFLMLEAKLDNFLFRLNFLPSVYFIKKFIKNGNVFVNNKKITFDSYLLEFSQLVSINKRYFKYVYCSLKSRLKKRLVLLNHPDFAEVDYKLLTAMLIRNPTPRSLTRPVSFELYTKYLTYNKY